MYFARGGARSAALGALERGRGAFDASPDSSTLAFAIVRVAGGFLYSDVIAGRYPDVFAGRAPGIARAVTVTKALMRGLGLVRRAPVTAGLREP